MITTNNWAGVDYKECKPYNIPSKKELYKKENIKR